MQIIVPLHIFVIGIGGLIQSFGLRSTKLFLGLDGVSLSFSPTDDGIDFEEELRSRMLDNVPDFLEILLIDFQELVIKPLLIVILFV